MNARMDPRRCREMFQQAIILAVRDAHSIATTGTEGRDARKARAWLSESGRDFREVCDLAGLDPDFIAEAWRDGKLTARTLKATIKERRA